MFADYVVLLVRCVLFVDYSGILLQDCIGRCVGVVRSYWFILVAVLIVP